VPVSTAAALVPAVWSVGVGVEEWNVGWGSWGSVRGALLGPEGSGAEVPGFSGGGSSSARGLFGCLLWEVVGWGAGLKGRWGRSLFENCTVDASIFVVMLTSY
jgi:hypothetical protein